MKYPLIISDFDGTLLRSDGTIGERTIRAIENHRRNGGIFAVSTGRMLPSILPEVEKLHLSGFVVSFNGAIVSDIETGEFLRFDGFEKSDAVRVASVLDGLGVRIHAYSVETLYTNYRDRFLEYYEKVCHVQATQVGCMSSFLRDSDFKVHKIVVMIEPERQKELLETLNDLFGDEFYVTTSAGILVEIAPKGQTKAVAVEFLANYYGIPIERTIALGDHLNDLPMLERAGLGIAVGNATQELKERADMVTVTNDEDAVGVIIEEYGMGE